MTNNISVKKFTIEEMLENFFSQIKNSRSMRTVKRQKFNKGGKI